MADKKEQPKVVSSLSMMFKKKSSEVNKDTEETKLEHRQGLKKLMDKYYDDVNTGRAEGIKNVKELSEVIKLDMLLMGEATEKIQTVTDVDEVKLSKFTQTIDMEDPNMQSLINTIFSQINIDNDSQDDAPKFKGDMPDTIGAVSVFNQDSVASEEIAQQSIISSDESISNESSDEPGDEVGGFEEI